MNFFDRAVAREFIPVDGIFFVPSLEELFFSAIDRHPVANRKVQEGPRDIPLLGSRGLEELALAVPRPEFNFESLGNR